MSKLNAAARRALKPSQFALPEKEAYPISNVSHGRAALSMAHNASPSEQATIKNKVHDKFPQIGAGKRMMKTKGGGTK